MMKIPLCMRRATFLLYVVLAFNYQSVRAGEQSSESRPSAIQFFPGKIAFPPLTANPREPRVGLRKEIGSSRMRLDIGNSIDLLEYRVPEGNGKIIRAGVDFFTYAFTTNSEGFRLQVDAVDGIFGGHVVYGADADTPGFFLRLRILHQSAHFVDGHFDPETDTWRDGKSPIPFTQDFAELLGAYKCEAGNPGQFLGRLHVMMYAGISYAMKVRPATLRRTAALQGLEIRATDPLGTFFEKPWNIYLAQNFSVTGVPQYIGSLTVESGIKLGKWSESGIKIFLNYYKGLDVFSQYYNIRREHWGVGFAFDFW